MHKLLIAAAAVALLATPAVAAHKSSQMKQGEQAQAQAQAPRLFEGLGVIQGNDVYDCDGKYLGSDPDPNVRQQMLEDSKYCK